MYKMKVSFTLSGFGTRTKGFDSQEEAEEYLASLRKKYGSDKVTVHSMRTDDEHAEYLRSRPTMTEVVDSYD